MDPMEVLSRLQSWWNILCRPLCTVYNWYWKLIFWLLSMCEETEYCPHWRRCLIKCLIPCLWQWILSVVTCQWIRPMRSKKRCEICCCAVTVPLLLFTVFTALVNLFPLGVFLYDWIKCPIQYNTVCYTLQFYSQNESAGLLPPIVAKEIDISPSYEPDQLFSNNETREQLQKFEDFSKLFILFSTTASSVSYILFVWALVCLYFRQCWRVIDDVCTCNCCCTCWKNFMKCLGNFWRCFILCCCCVRRQRIRRKGNDKIKPLDPFNNEYNSEDLDDVSIEAMYQHKRSVIEDGGESGAFFSKQDNCTSTPLQGERLSHYLAWYIIGLLFLAILLAVFFSFQYRYKKNLGDNQYARTIFKWEVSTLVAYSYSLICSIVSCFIFSKLMYGVQRRCEQLELYVFHVNETYLTACAVNASTYRADSDVYKYILDCVKSELIYVYEATESAVNIVRKFVPGNDINQLPSIDNITDEEFIETVKTNISNITGKALAAAVDANNEVALNAAKEAKSAAHTAEKLAEEFEKAENDKEKMALKYLQERDKHFVKMAVVTMDWFQLWFLFHWILYILSSFLAIALLLDAIVLHVRATLPHTKQGVQFHSAEMGVLTLLSSVHCFLLLYPCLRAATVTRTRKRLIKKISDEANKFDKIRDTDIISEFIRSMREKKFCFRLRILCARIPFNLNVAYISIVVGLIGVIASLITSVVT